MSIKDDARFLKLSYTFNNYEEMIREGISDYLTDCGYETIEAADGQEALEKFSSYEVALVLLDIQMPKLDGLEVAEGLGRQPLQARRQGRAALVRDDDHAHRRALVFDRLSRHRWRVRFSRYAS